MWLLITFTHKLLRFLSKTRGSEGTEQGQESRERQISVTDMKVFHLWSKGLLPLGAGLHPRAGQPALPAKPPRLPVWHLFVLPSYKLPGSLETIRSPLALTGEKLLTSEQKGSARKEGESPLVPRPCWQGVKRNGGGGEHKPKKVEKACLTRSHLTQVSKLIGRCMETPWALDCLAAAAGWSLAPPPHLWDGPCLQFWSTTPFLGGLQASSCPDIIGAWLPTRVQTE